MKRYSVSLLNSFPALSSCWPSSSVLKHSSQQRGCEKISFSVLASRVVSIELIWSFSLLSSLLFPFITFPFACQTNFQRTRFPLRNNNSSLPIPGPPELVFPESLILGRCL